MPAWRCESVWLSSVGSALVWEADLKEWLRQWAEEEHVTFEGMKPRQRVPHRDEKNVVCWK